MGSAPPGSQALPWGLDKLNPRTRAEMRSQSPSGLSALGLLSELLRERSGSCSPHPPCPHPHVTPAPACPCVSIRRCRRRVSTALRGPSAPPSTQAVHEVGGKANECKGQGKVPVAQAATASPPYGLRKPPPGDGKGTGYITMTAVWMWEGTARVSQTAVCGPPNKPTTNIEMGTALRCSATRPAWGSGDCCPLSLLMAGGSAQGVALALTDSDGGIPGTALEGQGGSLLHLCELPDS